MGGPLIQAQGVLLLVLGGSLGVYLVMGGLTLPFRVLLVLGAFIVAVVNDFITLKWGQYHERKKT